MAFSYFTKHTVLPVQVVKVLSEREEELRTEIVAVICNHRNRTKFCMLQTWNNFTLHIPTLLPIQNTPYTLPAFTCSSRVACLSHEAVLDVIEEAVIIVLEFTELEKVETSLGSLLSVQIHNQISY